MFKKLSRDMETTKKRHEGNVQRLKLQCQRL